MITPIIEKWLLNGVASFHVHNHAFSNFGRIPCPSGKVAIITKIIWYPFISAPYRAGVVTWNQYFRTNEYMLKVDGNKTVATYMIRNNVTFTLMNPAAPVDMDAVIAASDYAKLNIQPGDPFTIDTFIVCENEIKLTIAHNSFLLNNTFSFSNVPQVAGENNPPNGMNGLSADSVNTMVDFGNTMYYYPFSKEWAGGAAQPRGRDNYFIDLIQGDATSFTYRIPANSTATTETPLCSFHVIYVNAEIANKLQSTT